MWMISCLCHFYMLVTFIKRFILNIDSIFSPNSVTNMEHLDLGITVPKPDSRIMDFFPKNLFEVVNYTQTKNMKNENFGFGAT